MKKSYVLSHATARRLALEAVQQAPDGYAVTVAEPRQKDIQRDKYHSMIRDIAKQSTYAGRKWDEDDMKRILVDEFADEMRSHSTPIHHDSRIIPSESGTRVIQLGIQTSQFYKAEASNFIEWLYAWGSERSVRWTEPEMAR